LPINSVADLLAYGKAHPNTLNMASAGTGTPMHLAGELFKMRTGLDATHIPYKGIGPAYADLMSGKVEMAFSSIAGAIPFTENHRMRALAVTSLKRSELYPDVPTLDEAGLKGYDVDLWFGIFAPRPLPPHILKTINEAVKRVLAKPAAKEAFARVSFTPRGTTPEEGDAFLKSEFEKWRDVVVGGKISSQ
jgi:tripartite-type tricarboxylate transporter receptor subunit TctC